MRVLTALLAIVVATRLHADEPAVPYLAYAAQDEVYVRSGPGGNYYAVQTLKRGDAVKVVRLDPGGWCAIVPPPGSFNWIAADFVEPGPDDVGVVVGNSVAVRTGSVFGVERDVISARLYEHDEVLLLDPRKHALGPRNQEWYKIAPLGEELRWISARFLVDTPEEAEPAPLPAPVDEPSSLAPSESQPSKDLRGAADTKPDATIQLAAHEESAARVAGKKAPSKSAPGWRKPIRRPLRESRTADARNRAVERESSVASTRNSPGINVEFATLDELNVALAAIVAEEDASQWDLAPLLRSAESLQSKAPDSAQRKKIRQLVKRIKHFVGIRERWLATGGRSPSANIGRETAAAPVDSASTGSELKPPGGSTADAAPTESEPSDDEEIQRVELERRYDGVGMLTEVITERSDTPRFALLDGNGKVRMYLSAALGVNLRQQIGHRVGVEGRLGYLPEIKAQHIAVRKVERLDLD